MLISKGNSKVPQNAKTMVIKQQFLHELRVIILFFSSSKQISLKFGFLSPSALQVALRLAEEISSFPQQCLRADRSSAIYSSYGAPSFKEVKLPYLSALLSRNRWGGAGGKCFARLLPEQNSQDILFSRRCSLSLTAGVPSSLQSLCPAPPGSPKEQEEKERSHRAAARTGRHLITSWSSTALMVVSAQNFKSKMAKNQLFFFLSSSSCVFLISYLFHILAWQTRVRRR